MERFGFIIHPLSARQDIARKFPLAKLLPERILESVIKRINPFPVSHIEGIKSLTGAEAEGWFIGCPLTPRQFLGLPEAFVIQKIGDVRGVRQD